MEKTPQQTEKKLMCGTGKSVDMWAVQCDKCFKWRLIPTVEEYEEIRSKLVENPFLCSRKAGVSCEDPADINYNSSHAWVADKPGLPKTPKGFKRRLVMRSNYQRMDCYYDTPNGKVLKTLTQVEAFLKHNPDYKHLSPSDFSFMTPKVLEDTVPGNVAKKMRSPNQNE